MLKYNLLPADTPVLVPSEMDRFLCLILIERDVTNEYRNVVSDLLVRSGCVYAVSWGLDCSLWDDSVDWAFLEFWDYGPYPDESFVMTTWHDDETLEDTIAFAKHCVDTSDPQLEHILILDFGHTDRGAFVEDLFSTP